MPRKARLVVPGYPHHITQRGVRGLATFSDEADYRLYLKLFRDQIAESGLAVGAYCLMPNHVHVVAIPDKTNSLAGHFRKLHSTYAKQFNSRHGWKGHVWQERFYSVVMDEKHALAAFRYVELNPVRAGLCKTPEQWPWSSVHANLGILDDGIVDADVPARFVDDWSAYLAQDIDRRSTDSLRTHTRNGRPAGDDQFIDELEAVTGKTIRPRNPGPRPQR
jgi:putative transposase